MIHLSAAGKAVLAATSPTHLKNIRSSLVGWYYDLGDTVAAPTVLFQPPRDRIWLELAMRRSCREAVARVIGVVRSSDVDRLTRAQEDE
jgi:hypothetical protein